MSCKLNNGLSLSKQGCHYPDCEKLYHAWGRDRSLFSVTKEQTVVISCNNIFPERSEVSPLIAGIFLQVEAAQLSYNKGWIIWDIEVISQ